MIDNYHNLSLVWGVQGIVLQIVGSLMGQPLATTFGTVLLMISLAYHAKAKGRSAAWCIMGLLSIFGLVVMIFLKDHAKQTTDPQQSPT